MWVSNLTIEGRVNFSPVRRWVGFWGGRVRVRFCSQGGGRVREKLPKKADFFTKRDHFSYKLTLPKKTQKHLNIYI